MSPATDPIYTLFLWLGILALLIYIAADRIGAALAWIDRRNAEYDQQAADDHGEPSRADIETPWLFAADEFMDAPIYADLAAEQLRAELDCEAAVVTWLWGAR